MSVAAELKACLDALGTLGTLTIGDMPATPDAVGTIKEYGGRMPFGQFGVAGVQYERPSVQIKFRGVAYDYNTPRNRAEIAWRYLAAIQPGSIPAGTTVYLTITPQQSPFHLQKDQNNRHEIACNFWIEKELSV